MAKKAPLFVKLKDHFENDPARLPVIQQNYAFYERANLHLSVEELIRTADAPPEITGIVMSHEYHTASLSKFSLPKTAKDFSEGPIEYVDQELPDQKRLSCVKCGLYLFHIENQPFALLVSETQFGRTPRIKLDVMATSQEQAEDFMHELEKLVRHGEAFRGHVLSLEKDCFGSIGIKFHTLPDVQREDLILPESLLSRIERHTLAFSKHAKRLAAAGRHLKRGLLFYGPPGTGKTYTAMYLASRMSGRTVILLTGKGLGSIETACNMAKVLEPATIILEDVDLIGTQREQQMVDANALLFELLNQMDGLSNDADILFLLTTNRPDVLEPALASRPGRIDQAIEVPLPDEDCRRRLFQLYSDGLELDVKQLDEFIRRMEGVSAAFIREVLRKASVFAALDSSSELVVKDKHIEEALAELLVAGGTLTQSLLGAQNPNAS